MQGNRFFCFSEGHSHVSGPKITLHEQEERTWNLGKWHYIGMRWCLLS